MNKLFIIVILILLINFNNCFSKNNSSIINNKSLKKGNIYIYWPISTTHCTGGIAALNYLHHNLLKLGFKTYFHTLSSCYLEYYNGVNLDKFEAEKLKYHDFIIVPEIFATPYLIVPHLFDILNPIWRNSSIKSKGVRVIVWSLAALQLQPPSFNVPIPIFSRDLKKDGVIVIANSDYIRKQHDLYSSSNYIIKVPLTPEYYLTRSHNDKEICDDEVTIQFINNKIKSQENKMPIILMDKDCPESIISPINIKTKYDYNNNIIEYNKIILEGFSNKDLVKLYKDALIVVDFYVPGFERIVQEASLFGVIPIISNFYNGGNRIDFDLPEELFFDPTSEIDLFRAISLVIDNYSYYSTHKKIIDFRNNIRDLDKNSLTSISDLFDSSRMTIIAESCSNFDDLFSFAFLISLFHTNPLASVEVHVRDLRTFIIDHITMIEILSDQGLTDRNGGQEFHSLRFRYSRYNICPTFNNPKNKALYIKYSDETAAEVLEYSLPDSFLSPYINHGDIIIGFSSIRQLIPTIKTEIDSFINNSHYNKFVNNDIFIIENIHDITKFSILDQDLLPWKEMFSSGLWNQYIAYIKRQYIENNNNTNVKKKKKLSQDIMDYFPKGISQVKTVTPLPFIYAFPSHDLDSIEGPGLYRILEPGLTDVWFKIIETYKNNIDVINTDIYSSSKLNKQKPLCIDVGGNFGYYSLLASSLGCDVIVFEPVPSFRKLIEYNIELNPSLTFDNDNDCNINIVPDALTSIINNQISSIAIKVPQNGTLGTARVEDLIFEEDIEL
jgi:hypothetical protein